MEWYLYWMNNKILSPWFGSVLLKFKYLKGRSLNTIRYASSDETKVPGKIINNAGWHFSYLGGFKAIRAKLDAHPFQGRRVQLAKFLDFIRLRRFEKVIKKNKDIFFLDRKFHKVDIQKTFPNFLLKKKRIIEKYTYN